MASRYTCKHIRTVTKSFSATIRHHSPSSTQSLTLLWRRATEVEHWGSGKTTRAEIVFVVICVMYRYCAFKVDGGRLWNVVLSVFTVVHSVLYKSSELNYLVQPVAFPPRPPPPPRLKLIEMKIRFSNRMKGFSYNTDLSDHVPVYGNGCIWLIWNMSLTWFCLSLNVEIVKYWAWRFGGKDFVTFSRYYSFLVFFLACYWILPDTRKSNALCLPKSFQFSKCAAAILVLCIQ